MPMKTGTAPNSSNQHLYKGPSMGESFFHSTRTKARDAAAALKSLGQKKPAMNTIAEMFNADGTIKADMVPADAKLPAPVVLKTVPHYGLIKNLEVVAQTEGYIIARVKTDSGVGELCTMRVVDVNAPLFTGPGPKTNIILFRNVDFSASGTRSLKISEHAATVSKLGAALTQKLTEYPLGNDDVGVLVDIQAGFEIKKEQMECYLKQSPAPLQAAIAGLKNVTSKDDSILRVMASLKSTLLQQSPGMQLLLGDYIVKHLMTSGTTEDVEVKTFALFMAAYDDMKIPFSKASRTALHAAAQAGIDNNQLKAHATVLNINPELVEEKIKEALNTEHHGPDFKLTILPVKELNANKEGYAFLANRLAAFKKAANGGITPQETLVVSTAKGKAKK